MSLSVANHHASLPVAYRLYLPQDWAKDRSRRRKAGVPKEISFKTKPEIALEQLRWACEAGLPRGVVLMDAGYGADTDVRANVTTLRLSYVAGIMPNTTVWALGTGPLPPKKWSGQGRPPKLIRRDARHGPNSVKALALALPANAWRTIKWREGSADWLSSRLRVRVAHRDYNLTESRAEEWLLIEWPEEEKEPTKYWLSTLPEGIAFHRLVDIAKLRWRIERDYQELKQEVGLGHFEGRRWRGFHHHATLCIAAYGFLVAERETISPSGPRSTMLFPELAIPDGYRPRGSAATARASHPELDRNHASTADRRSRKNAGRQRRAGGALPWPADAFDQAVAIEHGMDGAPGRHAHITREPPHQEFADFARTPMRLAALELTLEVGAPHASCYCVKLSN